MSETSFTFTDAVKAGSKARVALIGPPGCGKTWTALSIARGFGGTVGVIDTEKGSAAKYVGPFTFKHLRMNSYNPADLTAELAAAADQHIDTVIVDSWSHFWEGTGGMLEQVDRKTRGAGRNDSFGSGWKEMAPVEQAMLDALTGYPGHVIVTLRVKVDYVIEYNDRTKKHEPKRVGLKPIQRGGTEYEFDVVGDMDDTTLVVTKTRCPDLYGYVKTKPGDDLGVTILKWLEEDATGEAFDALAVREWALDPARTLAELADRAGQVERDGQGGVAINDPRSGVTTNVVEFLRTRWREVRAAQAQAPARPAAQPAPPTVTE